MSGSRGVVELVGEIRRSAAMVDLQDFFGVPTSGRAEGCRRRRSRVDGRVVMGRHWRLCQLGAVGARRSAGWLISVLAELWKPEEVRRLPGFGTSSAPSVCPVAEPGRDRSGCSPYRSTRISQSRCRRPWPARRTSR